VKVLFDTNVVLDLMLDRKPFSIAAAQLFSKVEHGELTRFVGATTITTIHYLASKTIGQERARQEIQKLFTLFEIAPIDRFVLENAVKSNFFDFEDAVLHEAAKYVSVSAIVTRNVKGFQEASLKIYAPQELLNILSLLRKKE